MQARPLSAFAPRVLSVKSLNEVALPASPEQVRLERAERAKAVVKPRGGGGRGGGKTDGSSEDEGVEVDSGEEGSIGKAKVVSPIRNAENRAPPARTGGLARFMFSGEVVRSSQVL